MFENLFVNKFVLLCLGSFSLFNMPLETRDAQIRELDTQIEQVQADLETNRLKIMKAEVESEDYMKNQWGNYVENAEIAEKHEHQLRKLEKKLSDLEIKREKISNHNK